MIRLTIELKIEPELPNQWASRCVELDVMSAGKTPGTALEAVAEAVRMHVDYEVQRSGLTSIEAFEAIRVRALRREAAI
jgi:predicted RNase H-like HicB family nuclease